MRIISRSIRRCNLLQESLLRTLKMGMIVMVMVTIVMMMLVGVVMMVMVTLRVSAMLRLVAKVPSPRTKKNTKLHTCYISYILIRLLHTYYIAYHNIHLLHTHRFIAEDTL